ncbi:MAG: hypothetical protein AB1490_25805 [Pseudomonadota bacterium]
MRKPIYLIGMCALAAAAIFVWSQNALAPSRANTASASLLPHQPLSEAATAATLAMPPTEIDVSQMHKNIKTLPEEKFHDMTFVFSHGD